MMKRRNYYMDIMKGVACFGVILAHCSFPGMFGDLVVVVMCRWTMPIFFMISGYFAWNSDETSCKRKTKHIFQITMWASLFYLVIALIQNAGDIGKFLRSEITLKNIGAFVVFNSPMVIEDKLWFLYALLYVYILFWLLVKKNWVMKSYIFVPIALGVHIGIAYSSRIFNLGIANGFVRNFLLDGFPCFMFGHWLHEREEKIHTKQASRWLIVGSVCAFVAIGEYMWVGPAPLHICSIIAAGCFMIFAIKAKPNAQILQSRICKTFSTIGEKLSLPIYIIHPVVIKLFDSFINAGKAREIIQWIRPMNTIFWTIFLAVIYEKVRILVTKWKNI